MTEDNDNSQLPAGIAKIATPVIDTLPKDKRAAVAQIAREVSRYHSGPLPDPETLAHYSRIIPNGAERIMALVEREAAHRHTQEARLIDCQIKTTHYGQWMGAGLTVLLAGASARLRRSTAPSRRVGKDTPTRTMNAAIARNRRAHFESLTY